MFALVGNRSKEETASITVKLQLIVVEMAKEN
jgi:hypothetical protein